MEKQAGALRAFIHRRGADRRVAQFPFARQPRDRETTSSTCKSGRGRRGKARSSVGRAPVFPSSALSRCEASLRSSRSPSRVRVSISVLIFSSSIFAILTPAKLFLQTRDSQFYFVDSALPIGDQLFSRVEELPFVPDFGLVLGDHVAVARDVLSDFFTNAHALDISYRPLRLGAGVW